MSAILLIPFLELHHRETPRRLQSLFAVQGDASLDDLKRGQTSSSDEVDIVCDHVWSRESHSHLSSALFDRRRRVFTGYSEDAENLVEVGCFGLQANESYGL